MAGTEEVTASGQTDHDARNAKTRARLRDLVGQMSDDELGMMVSDGWTVAAALAHVAFWDRFTLERWRAVIAGSPLETNLFGPVVFDLTNAAASPQWHALDPRRAAEDALTAAEELDAVIASLPATAVDAAIRGGRPGMLDRARHRDAHLDRIDAALREAN